MSQGVRLEGSPSITPTPSFRIEVFQRRKAQTYTHTPQLLVSRPQQTQASVHPIFLFGPDSHYVKQWRLLSKGRS